MIGNRKIFNDPVYGFITIPSDFILSLLESSIFQRLRRIKQLGLTEMVYPGAVHTRFHHALGAMHLMNETLEVLQSKGILIMDIEKEAALAAILLHDIGHGPFSHVLEYHILDGVSHETLTLLLMEKLNKEYKGRLSLAIDMFKGKYERPFFHELISSQLDMDRLDYLNRDSFYTGVIEGTIGAERILKMLNVANNQLVVEEKGLLTVENYLAARKLMYWQVYLHKTALCAESMLYQIFRRIRYLLSIGAAIPLPLMLELFLSQKINKTSLENNPQILENFLQLEDTDIWYTIKQLQYFKNDIVLSILCQNLLNRTLFKIKFDEQINREILLETLKEKLKQLHISEDDLDYFFYENSLSICGYNDEDASIKILLKNLTIQDISEKSHPATMASLKNIIKKQYICYYK
ncbi:MAG: HD domain-containing protein [Leadbetterella sp.]